MTVVTDKKQVSVVTKLNVQFAYTYEYIKFYDSKSDGTLVNGILLFLYSVNCLTNL